MNSTELFKQTIEAHLNKVAAQEPAFAEKLTNPEKNMDDCTTYIINQVQKSGCNGFADSEIFGMAMHYYDEAQVEVGKPVNCSVVVNHTVELTKEDNEAAKEEARNKVMQEEMERLRKKNAPKKPAIQPEVVQSSLF